MQFLKHVFVALISISASVPVLVSAQDLAGDMTLHRLLIPGEGWQLVAENLSFADGPTCDDKGNFYYCDMRSKPPGIYRVSHDGKSTKVIEASASGLKFGPDGRLYACQGALKRLVAFDIATGKETVIAEDVQPNDLVVTHKGHIYITETGKKQITFIDSKTGAKRAVDTGITAPNGITVSPDQGTLAVSDSRGMNVWTFRIEPDGSLTGKGPYMTLRTDVDLVTPSPDNRSPVYKTASSGDGMTSDAQGRYYVSSALGVQVFDPTGRMCGVLPKPSDKGMTSVGFAGPNMEYMFVTCGDKIFKRKTLANGNMFFKTPPVEDATKKK